MSSLTRRAVIAGSLSPVLLAAGCGVDRIASTRGEIDARVDAALSLMYQDIPGSLELSRRAVGMLVMPEVGELNFFGGGSYGEGALLIGNAKVDYYAQVGASFGFQFGAQRYNHALLFMTREALAGFRASDGWELGADAEFVTPETGRSLTVSTSTFQKPIYALIFGQQGVSIGAALEGAKYSRIVR